MALNFKSTVVTVVYVVPTKVSLERVPLRPAPEHCTTVVLQVQPAKHAATVGRHNAANKIKTMLISSDLMFTRGLVKKN